MDRHAVALVLDEIATLLDARGDNRFKARAFRTAARAVEKLDADLRAAVASGELRDVRGIGPATARVIEELVVTGESNYHAELREQAPSGMRELLRVPGLGAKKIAQLFAELRVADLDSLELAAREGRIAELRGFGERTQQRILEGLAFARHASGRRRYHQAEELATRLSGFVGSLPGVARAALAGELRRRCEVVDTVRIVAAVTTGTDGFAEALKRMPGVRWVSVEGDTVTGRLGDGLRVDVTICDVPGFGTALLRRTGTAAHVAAVERAAAARGVALHDVRTSAELNEAEAAIYGELGLDFVPPELRETGEEVELAQRGALPRLIEPDDLNGCFHCHTTWSDGKATVQEMAEGALAAGWRYLGIADHSSNARYAGGLPANALRRQQLEIASWNRRRGGELWLFAGVEADILADGTLDYAATGGGVLDILDYVIGSVHSGFRMGRAAMTQRMRVAVADPKLTMLGHATGRLLLTRDGYDVDIDAVIDEAAAHGALIEINADPHRLDLSWQHWPRARQRGVRTAINPDAHSVGGMYNVRYGVNIARKAWLRREDVLNAWSLDDVKEFLRQRQARDGAR
jgi:DNA polymerase (family X)